MLAAEFRAVNNFRCSVWLAREVLGSSEMFSARFALQDGAVIGNDSARAQKPGTLGVRFALLGK